MPLQMARSTPDSPDSLTTSNLAHAESTLRKPQTTHQLCELSWSAGDRIKELVAAAQMLLDVDPACVDVPGLKGWTPLQTAAEFGCLGLVEVLHVL